MQQNDKPWKQAEDNKLIQLVNKFKIGDFINWGDVASCIEKRTKQQIYFRWMYSLAPHLKKGRFTEEEDKLLIDAIEKYGLNFKKISAFVLPARTSAQLSDHYNTIANKEENVWTIEQDSKLIDLYREYGNDWAKIATFFDSKGRVQLRHRYTALVRYRKRGYDLDEIPRNNARDKSSRQGLVFQKIPMNSVQTMIQLNSADEIDDQILDYFNRMVAPSVRVGRPQKFYHSKEVEVLTKKLYNILQQMSANLNIPYDLDEFDCMTEKEKQLLTSLKNFNYSAVHGTFSKKVEHTRLMMFGSGSKSREEGGQEKDNHFIPPLPFGTCSKTNKFQQMINCEPFLDRNIVCNEEKIFETPFSIIQLIGEPVNNQFDKLGELFAKPSCGTGKQRSRRIYILTPADLMKKEIHKQIIIENRNQIAQSVPSTSRASTPDVTILGSYTRNKLAFSETELQNFPAVKPNYWTLLGYQRILDAENEMKNKNNYLEVDKNKMSVKGRMALNLLQARLIQLFKYPIIMSQIIPPENFHETELIFESPLKRKIFSKEPSEKKRRIT